MLYGRHFVYVNDLFLGPEAQTLPSYTMTIGQFRQDIHLLGVKQDPKDSKESPLYAPGAQVLIKVWKDGSPKARVQSHMKGPLPCNTFYPHSSRGTRTWLLDSLLTSQDMKENRRGHSIHLWAPGRSGLQMSVILMNTPKTWFMGIRFLKIALKSQHSLEAVVLQNG